MTIRIKTGIFIENWHIGDPLPQINDSIVTLQADGDELELILDAMAYSGLKAEEIKEPTMEEEVIRIRRTPFKDYHTPSGYIGAIKYVRSRKGWGLREAKEYVDKIGLPI